MENDFKFDCDSHEIMGVNLSYLDSGGEKTPLHFYHANGFPVSVYIPFMDKLADDYRVMGLSQRGQDSQTEGNVTWLGAGLDLIDFLDSKNLKEIIGVGHSIGAVATMMAACLRPDLFKKLILIDPVMLPYKYIAAMAFIRLIGKKELFVLAKRARARKNLWTSRTEAYEYFKGKKLFKNFEDEYIRSYVTYGLKEAEKGGVELVCPPDAEAKIFENYPLDAWLWPNKITTKTLIIRGEHSDVLFDGTIKRFCRKSKFASPYTVKGAGHLIPMEKPDEIIGLINKFVNG